MYARVFYVGTYIIPAECGGSLSRDMCILRKKVTTVELQDVWTSMWHVVLRPGHSSTFFVSLFSSDSIIPEGEMKKMLKGS